VAGDPQRVLFVCMGNICRSPTAEGVFRHLVEAAGLSQRIQLDSAGTHDYHVGRPPDPRSCAAARSRGYRLDELRARQVSAADFAAFDYILAMDEENLAHLKALAPAGLRHKARLFLDFSKGHRGEEVPDPYYGRADGFEWVLDLVEEAAAGLLEDIKEKLSRKG
jgi:protein-tyrosine phosphatase